MIFASCEIIHQRAKLWNREEEIPRNGSDVYSKPSGTTAVANTTIESAKFNSVVDDIVADLNLARPIVAGGTGATTKATARDNLDLSNISDNGIKDTVPFFDNADNTKTFRIQLSGITTSTERVWAMPDNDDTFVGIDATQTLTNKTLTAPQIYSGVANDGLVIKATSGVGYDRVTIDNGTIGWGVTPTEWISYVSGGGFVIYDGSALAVRIGVGDTTQIPSVYSNTTANAANVFVGSLGNLLRSTSTGEFKTERRPVGLERKASGGDIFSRLSPVSFKSEHVADGGRRFMGFLAEDVAREVPEASIDGGQNYDVRALVAVLWAKVQEQERRLSAIEERL